MGRIRQVCLAVVAASIPVALGIVSLEVTTPPRPTAAAQSRANAPAARPAPPALRPQTPPVLAATATAALPPARPQTPRTRRVPPPPPAPGPCDTPLAQLLAQELELTPRFQGPSERRAVALTFDDGPSVQNTPSVLRTLERTGTPATFFLLGERVKKAPELTARIAAAGHELANHTWSHASLRSLFKSQIRDELCRTSAAIEDAAGVRPTRFRPPFGRYPESALPLIAALGLEVELWSVDADDWKHDDPEALARQVVGDARPGAIVLLHDRESITARALPSIIGGLRARGFEIVPLADL